MVLNLLNADGSEASTWQPIRYASGDLRVVRIEIPAVCVSPLGYTVITKDFLVDPPPLDARDRIFPMILLVPANTNNTFGPLYIPL